MKLLAMRHGQTNYNLLGLCNDDPRDAVHLTELGCAQARATGEALRTIPVEHIFVSPLPRTRETADIIGHYLNAPVTVHDALADIRSGFNNRPVADYFAATGHDRLHTRVNGGESLLDYKARVSRFVEFLAGRREQTVLAVAHEETLRALSALLRGLSNEEMERLAFGNGEVIELRLP